jgi:small subunit ribosomal protein S3
MGQKVNPVGMRIGINKDWTSKWYANNKDFAKYLKADTEIRKYLDKKLKDAAVSSININRTDKKTEVVIYTAKPGVVIGHGGEEIEKLKNELSKLTKENIIVSIFEVKNRVKLTPTFRSITSLASMLKDKLLSG